MTKTVIQDANAETEENAPKTHQIERFYGVQIKVNFANNSKEGSTELAHLSGGQKSLVALAFIFAIQKCDPAPFYLFDEIAAALDQKKRRAVAEPIGDLSTNAQFIATTFRPEMIEYSSKCYGVRKKVSYISVVDSSEALQFISLDDEVNKENTDVQIKEA